ncbi:MAG: Rpn family recombination-promoting nuclease/putative transposase [Chitinispirillales bacterium]|jgi:predicted transposase/invertase (TIGR01784 family)|nr:Rpn family recombination-promoting nuclease/putative transposase [Chitinispirillales bacterium]
MSERTIISFDYAIKTILRDKANFDILEGFLSELLKRKVTVLDILESESNRRLKGGKTNRVDLKAKIDNGELAIFEIQFADQVDFFGKILYSSSKAIVEQIGKGKKFNIKKVYSINIAYFNFSNIKREYLFHADMLSFKGMHYSEQIPFAQNDELAPPPLSKKYIHPEYYLILPNMFSERIKTRFDEWMHILKNSTVKKGFKAKGTKQAGIKLDVLKMTAVEQKIYEKFLMDRQSIDSAMWTAEVKGRAEGRAEGEAIGERKGSVNEKMKIAKKLKKTGMDAKTIALVTELTMDEIKKIK